MTPKEEKIIKLEGEIEGLKKSLAKIARDYMLVKKWRDMLLHQLQYPELGALN